MAAIPFVAGEFAPKCCDYVVEYARATLNWDGVPVDFSGRQYVDGDFRMSGAGNAVYLDMVNNNGALNKSNTVMHARPLILNFENFYLPDRDGEDISALLVDGGFKADPRYPWSQMCPKVGSG